MKWYPWLRPAYEKLVESYQAGRGHHALLIQALPGMGDEALCYALSRYLLCQQPEGHKSCGHCRGCQLMQAGTHPDYYTLTPDKGKSSLGVDAVREVSEKLYEHSRLGGAKVVWIADAALLTPMRCSKRWKSRRSKPGFSLPARSLLVCWRHYAAAAGCIIWRRRPNRMRCHGCREK